MAGRRPCKRLQTVTCVVLQCRPSDVQLIRKSCRLRAGSAYRGGRVAAAASCRAGRRHPSRGADAPSSRPGRWARRFGSRVALLDAGLPGACVLTSVLDSPVGVGLLSLDFASWWRVDLHSSQGSQLSSPRVSRRLGLGLLGHARAVKALELLGVRVVPWVAMSVGGRECVLR